MRQMFAACLVTVAVSLSQAQDGIYGSFIVGHKFINVDELNTAMNQALNTAANPIQFPSNYWTFGGEGHIIVAKHFMVGGKGMAVFNQKEIPSVATDINGQPLGRFAKVTAGMGVGNIGYAFVGAGERLRLYPQVGAGITTFLFQIKQSLDPNSVPTFGDILTQRDDYMIVLQKVGFALDFCLGFDWFVNLIELKALIPGLTFGPMFHAEAGYTIVPGDLKWMRDVDQLAAHYPSMKFQGFYFNVGVGFGLTSSED
jgi:hypothetical protein